MRVCSRIVVFVVALGLSTGPAAGQCPAGCQIKGGAPAELDCHVEFASTTMRLNFPAFNPAAPAPGQEVRCFDGEPGCDTDASIDHACIFNIDVCLQNDDPQLPDCQPTGLTSVTVAGAANDPDLQALQDAIDALLPTSSNVCTSGQRLTVPLQGQGSPQLGQKTVELISTTDGGATVSDRLVVGCVPYGWPSHGFNHANHRSNPNETTLNPTNAADLEVKWRTDFGTPTTSTPAVGNGFVYATSWNGNVYALNPADGEIVWTTNIGGQVMSTATLTADGRLLAIGSTNVACMDAFTGEVLWEQDVRERLPDHAWSSPQVANGRVFIGISAFTDDPCSPGRLVALDLDTGEPLWTYRTLPPRVCENDTSILCTGNADCGGAACRVTCGAGFTATVAVDHTGEIVYANTVGSFTFPSVGDDVSILKLEAATGEAIWKNRLGPTEQFGSCENDPGKDCGTDADCDGSVCEKPKRIYHDFGFLNGPILIDADEGPGGTQALVVSGGKEGTLYALDPDDGSIVWTNVVRPSPATSAGFGLFNAAVGYADGRFHAAFDGSPFFRDPPLEEHLYAFSVEDGATMWRDEIGASWGSMALANGVLFVGTGTTNGPMRCDNDEFVSCESDADCPGGSCVERGPYYVYDAETGTRLKEFVLPAPVASGASIVDGAVYVGFGIFSAGGVIALGLPTGTAMATATPTGLPAGTATATATPAGVPTGTAAATATPTEAPEVTATGGPVVTPTDGPAPTVTPTSVPTATALPPTKTPRPPGTSDNDDTCAIVPVSRAEPMRSSILLIVPAVLLWRRRRH